MGSQGLQVASPLTLRSPAHSRQTAVMRTLPQRHGPLARAERPLRGCGTFVRRWGMGCWVLLGLALGAAAAPSLAEAQMVVGRTIDQVESTPVGGVELRFYLGDRLVTRATSDAEGWFRAPVPQAGVYRVSAFVFGYEPQDSIRVTVPEGQEQIMIPVRMTQRPLLIQGIEVTADRAQDRFLLNWTGFERRREILPPIGNARAVGRDDPEMRSAGSVREVLRWFLPAQTGVGGRQVPPVEYYLDGFPISEEALRTLPFDLIAGVEYYRYGYEAPVGGGQQPVVMVWKDPPPPRDGRGGGGGGGGGN